MRYFKGAFIFMVILGSCAGDPDPSSTKNNATSATETHSITGTSNDKGETEVDLDHVNSVYNYYNKTIAQDLDSARTKFGALLAFTDWDGERYYYVTEDTIPWARIGFDNMPDLGLKIGLANADHQLILPIEYDKIYGPNQIAIGAVVVKKDGKLGLFYPKTGKLIEPIFDGMYPSSVDGVAAFVQQVDKLGRLLTNGELLYDVDANKLMDDAIWWGIDHKDPRYVEVFLAVPNIEDQIEYGTGILFTPEYLRSWGVLGSDRCDLVPMDDRISDVYFGAESIDMTVTSTESLWDGLWAAFVKFTEAGVDGREFVLSRQHLVTLDNKLTVLDTIQLIESYEHYTNCKDDLQISVIDLSADSGSIVVDDTVYRMLVETKYQQYSEDSKLSYSQIPVYKYTGIDDKGKIHQLDAPRFWDCTKYVRMDDSYFEGCFLQRIETDEEGYNVIKTEHLSVDDLDLMRNEIYAEHGYIFKSKEWRFYFVERGWYRPLRNNVDHLLTDIEKYNIELILKKKEELKEKGEELLKTQRDNWYEAG